MILRVLPDTASYKNNEIFKEETIMGLFSKLFKGPEIDMEKSNATRKKCGPYLTKSWKMGTIIG